ncbi:MAG: PAS domain-containing protein [Deltaproteobacteria bacterium]|nr:PAS domain-containing protein [Deltaproteobacteria bacterium]
MGKSKSKTKSALYIPSITLIAIVMTLLVLIAISTYRNLHRERMRMEEYLVQEGSIIIRALEAGARTSMMDMMMWGESQIQTLIREFSSEPLLHSISIFDRRGIIVAHSDPVLVGQQENNFLYKKSLFDAKPDQGPMPLSRGPVAFEVGKLFVPIVPKNGFPRRRHSMMRTLPEPGQYAVVVNMRMDPILESTREDFQHALIMGGILFALGSASIFFIFVVYHLTITRRTLESVEAYTQQLVKKMPEGLVGVDSEGKITSVNPRAREMFHLPKKLPDDLSIEDLIPGTGPELMNRLRRDGEIIEWEVECNRHGESLPLAVSAAALPDDENNESGAVIIMRDLRQIRKLQRQVRQRERLAALGSLAAGVAHEIRNPLTALRGLSHYFQKDKKPGSLDRKYSEVMISEVDRLNRVVSGLLDYARPRDLVISKTDLVVLIDHVLDLIRDDVTAKGVELEFLHDDDIPIMHLDPDQISQALLNILLNALASMPGGGKLKVRLQQVEGKEVHISVADTGCGIPEENIPRLFDPFFTTKPKGSGLGLAIVHRVVDSHKGRITVDSKAGKGTRFSIFLPVSSGKDSQPGTLTPEGKDHGPEAHPRGG